MDFKFPIKDGRNPRDLIRRAGYGEWFDKGREVTSYTRKLGSENYPRFHVYLKEGENIFEVSLHLDQKHVSYEGSKAHAGEYDGEKVENEARRITSVIAEVYGM